MHKQWEQCDSVIPPPRLGPGLDTSLKLPPADPQTQAKDPHLTHGKIRPTPSIFRVYTLFRDDFPGPPSHHTCPASFVLFTPFIYIFKVLGPQGLSPRLCAGLQWIKKIHKYKNTILDECGNLTFSFTIKSTHDKP